VARNRQQAKQRQAERRARRLAQEKASGAPASGDGARTARDEREEHDELAEAELLAGAPPHDEGRSDTVVEEEPVLDDDDEHLTEEEIEAEEEAEEELAGRGEEGFEVRGRRGRHDPEAHKHRPRVVQFLIAVWAELQRVQWPDRQALTTLTGVVLGFVLIMGGYLGLLDAIFSEVIKALI
jgi:preprotein translocase subunit SecE